MRFMKTGMLFTAAMALAAVMGASPAGAQTNWTGCYLGAAAGATFANTELDLGGGSIDGLASQGLAVRAGGGCNYQLSRTSFVVGIGGDYTFQNPEFNINPFFTSGLDDSWTVFGRAGIAHGNALPYVLAGYTQTQWHTNVPAIPTPDLKGWTVGGGLEFKLNNEVSLGAEYRFTRYDTQTIGFVDLNTDQHSVMVAAKYQIGGLFK